MADDQYFVQGTDQEFGPYTLEQVRGFVPTGNITAASRLRIGSGPWVAATEVPGLGELLAPVPPVQPGLPDHGYAPPGAYGQPAYGQPAYAPYGRQRSPYESDKSFVTAILLSVLVGGLGVDRFYLGYTGLGVAKLLTCGGCGIWSLIDIILIATGKLVDSDGRPLAR